MVFSSPIFLFAFLPIVLALYFASPHRLRNAVLLLASLLFYAWGELGYTAVMIVSIAANYGFGRWIDAARGRRWPLALGVVFNLGLLGWFKYANFVTQNLGLVLAPVHLPIGISFFTFHALSYLIDLYRGRVPVQRRLHELALYITLFPQLIAGPIVRYEHVAASLHRRSTRLDDFAEGVRRFVLGLGKKLLIANALAVPADEIFALAPDERGVAVAWLGVLCYTLQIYFDFSGYSDMAIGLARMFGFRFRENFDYPYISASIREFWRRWHISLSTWFRDYLYLPLGGSRISTARTYANLLCVFLLCGFWHGASFSFLVWGLFHGVFLVLERVGLESLLLRAWAPVRHLYTVGVVMLGWVFFRADTLGDALGYLRGMFGLASTGVDAAPLWTWLTPEVAIMLVVGVLGSTPWLPALRGWRARLRSGRLAALSAVEFAALVVVFVGSAMKLAAGTHNPFIYFRF